MALLMCLNDINIRRAHENGTLVCERLVGRMGPFIAIGDSYGILCVADDVFEAIARIEQAIGKDLEKVPWIEETADG
jgi:hypothetical protein